MTAWTVRGRLALEIGFVAIPGDVALVVVSEPIVALPNGDFCAAGPLPKFESFV